MSFLSWCDDVYPPVYFSLEPQNMDDGNILKNARRVTVQSDTQRETEENTVDLRICPILCNIRHSLGNLNVDTIPQRDRGRFKAWRHTMLPTDYLVHFLEGIAGETMVRTGSIHIEDSTVLALSTLVKMYIGDLVTKTLTNKKDGGGITRRELLQSRDDNECNSSSVI